MKSIRDTSAVSPVVGEMLMLSLVLILIAVASNQIFLLLPHDRAPTVTVLMTNSSDSLTLWHKGGDWVDRESIRVLIRNSSGTREYRYGDAAFNLVPEKQVFDLGSRITITGIDSETITSVELVAGRAVVFSGVPGR
ncbi:MAG: type IV pilin N-terminal domain-containing protein [Methanoculleaceae archaeon]